MVHNIQLQLQSLIDPVLVQHLAAASYVLSPLCAGPWVGCKTAALPSGNSHDQLQGSRGGMRQKITLHTLRESLI